MEKLQERAFCCMYDDFNLPYSDLLIKVDLPSLLITPIRSMAIETFKIINDKRDLNLNFRYTNILQIPHHNIL